ncbi:hypothetical protein [Pedobacter sp. SYSU D00535]|uniref:hypothetical protein n=1 Tax=Pedobacter sp. SYSU D00535 TaxID=2810308 RepID=UPI001A9565A1|nr:hypothetical protein [Pedobacter sp. SYSU D00535]
MKNTYSLLAMMFTMLAGAASAQDSADSSKFSIFTVGASAGNTANYYGQTTAAKLPYGSFDVSYSHKSGLWLSGTTLKFKNTADGISEVDIAAGYDFDILRNLSGSLSYTRFFFPKDSPLPQSINPNTASAGLKYSWFLETAGYGDYVFGSQGSDYYLTLSNSKLFDLGSLFSKSDYITIEPSISLTGATQVVGYETTESGSDNNESGGSILDDLTGGKKPLKDKKKLPGPKNGLLGSDDVTTVNSYNQLSLLNTNVRLPLAYNRSNYSIEAAYQLSLPNKNFDGIDQKVRSFFTLGFYYSFY